MPFLRQSTIQVIRFGPFLDFSDGVTEEESETITPALRRLSKDGAAFAATSDGSNAVHDSDGWYSATLTAADTDTVGELILNVQVPANHLPVWMRWWVIEETVYDRLFGAAAGGYVQATVPANTLDVSGAGNAGIDWSNIEAPGTAQDLAGTDIQLVDTCTANTDMRGTENAALASVLGALADAAADGDPTTVDTIMQYLKQLVNVLVGGTGVVVYPTGVDPANNVNLAEVLRAIRDDVTAIAGSAMRGTDSAALAAVATEARLAELDAANLPTTTDDILADVTGIAGAAMRGTDNAALASVLGALTDAASAGDVTTVDTLMQYLKQVINTLEGAPGIPVFPAALDPANNVSLAESIRAIRDDVTTIAGSAMRGTDSAALASVATEARLAELDAANLPTTTDDILADVTGIAGAAMRGTDNAALASVLGTLADAAAAGDVTTADTIMQYLKQVINTLEGAPGIPVYPAAVDPANNVSMAEALRAIRDDVTAIAGAAMRGTDSAALASVATEVRLAELDAANIPSDVDAILVDTTGLNGDPMRGTDSAALASVLGTLADAAAAGEVTTVDTIMQYLKQIINTLEGIPGMPVYPAAADPANNVSIAEALRAIRDDVTAIAGAAMRGTDGVDTAAMRGTDNAALPADLGYPQQNQAFSNIEFLMVLSSDNVSPATGLTVTGQRSIDGGAFAGVSGTITEVANGIYQFDALAADMNGGTIMFRFSSATANDTFVFVKTRT